MNTAAGSYFINSVLASYPATRWQKWYSRPIQIELAMRRCAVSQIQIDEALIRNTGILRYGLEIADRFFVKSNRDLFFELRCVGVFSGSSEVVFFAHVTPLRVGL